MEPKIVDRPPLHLVGLQIRTRDMSPEIPALWPRFVPRIAEIAAPTEPGVTYGVMVAIAGEAGGLLYTAAVAAAATAPVPAGMTALDVPGGRYAVFEFPFADITSAFPRIFRDWLPASGFVVPAQPFFERYGAGFDVADPAATMQVHLPIERRG